MFEIARKYLLVMLAYILSVSEIFAQPIGSPVNTPTNSSANNQTNGTPIQTITTNTPPLTSNTAPTDSAPTPLPKVIILPWQTPGIDTDALQRTKAARSELTAKLKTTVAPNAVALDTIAPKIPRMEAARYTLKETLADPNANFPTPIAIFPLWTRIHDYDFFGLVVIDSEKNTIKKVLHRVIPRARWIDAVKSRMYQEYLGPEFTELTSALNLNSLPASNEDIAVAFRDQTASSRENEVDRSMIAIMLTNQWPGAISMLNPFASEMIAAIHGFYGQVSTMRKANREVMTRIIYDKPPINLKLPVTVTMNIRATDGVFGQTLPWMWSEPLTINVKPDNTLDLQTSDRLKKELSSESSSLRRDELPQIVKIRGAWAYVDKGRAWGLKMNDRLISNDDPQKIKGQVVAYFGPELKLKSQRGWPIHEGAIIFIRKGQKEIRVGQTLTYDGMKVPTPWPPEPASGK